MNALHCCRLALLPLLLLAISSSSETGFHHAQARVLQRRADDDPSKTVNEDSQMILRAQIGSHPPRCARRCFFCRNCEAIQVPTNPQVRTANSTAIPVIAYARGDDTSNYKPMSWKCKCGNMIFNP